MSASRAVSSVVGGGSEAEGGCCRASRKMRSRRSRRAVLRRLMRALVRCSVRDRSGSGALAVVEGLGLGIEKPEMVWS